MALGNDPINTLPEEEGRKRNYVAIILLVLLVLGSAGFNIYQYMTMQEKEEKFNKEFVSSQDLRAELEKELAQTMASLEEYRGRASKLDTLVAEKERDLLQQKQRIESLLKDNKISYNKYLIAKDEIEKWKFYAKKYLGELETVKKENQRLVAQNQELQTEITGKKTEISLLSEQNTKYKNKVDLAAKLTASNITATGVHFRGSGKKESETNRASKLEKFKICYQVGENKVADQGDREVYLQVLDPGGQPLVIEGLGAGTTVVEGQQMQYTTKEMIEYNNEPQTYCIYWGKDGEYMPGQYTFILFTEGYRLGEKTLTIK